MTAVARRCRALLAGVAWFAAALPASQAASAAVEPPLADSRCPAGALVDDAFRDAALTALRRLVVTAPGQAADGAVRAHHTAGHLDGQGHAWQQVSAYSANLALVGALRVSPALLPVVEGWLRWQARHIAGDGATRGVVTDRWVRADTLEQSSCPPGLDARLCGHVDAFDSTAASTLLMADAFLRHGGGTTLLREPSMRAALEAAAAALRELTTAEGLTWALPGHRVAYTMDAVEVVAGWRAWSRVQRQAYAEPASAEVTLGLAARAQAAIDTRLWDRTRGQWRVSAEASPADTKRWYPDTMAQAWPLLWGHEPATRARDLAAWRRAIAPWQRAPVHWAERSADPDGFSWPAVAVAAHCSGDTAAAQRWVGHARLRWMRPAGPFAWPFTVGDLLWLLWLAEPQAAAPAAASPTPLSVPPVA